MVAVHRAIIFLEFLLRISIKVDLRCFSLCMIRFFLTLQLKELFLYNRVYPQGDFVGVCSIFYLCTSIVCIVELSQYNT